MTLDGAACRGRRNHDSVLELYRFSVGRQQPNRLGCGPAEVDAALDTTQALRLDPARRDTIDPNLLFGELDRGRAGPRLDPGLGCIVMCIRTDRALLRAYRGNLDDSAAFSGLHHPPQLCAQRVKGAAGAAGEHEVPLSLRVSPIPGHSPHQLTI